MTGNAEGAEAEGAAGASHFMGKLGAEKLEARYCQHFGEAPQIIMAFLCVLVTLRREF